MRFANEYGGSADRADAERLALLIAGRDVNDAAEIMQRARVMAAQLVGTHRHAIFSLANQLFQRGSLTGAEVRELLRTDHRVLSSGLVHMDVEDATHGRHRSATNP